MAMDVPEAWNVKGASGHSSGAHLMLPLTGPTQPEPKYA